MDPITLTVNNAAKAIGIGRVSLYKAIKEGKLDTVLVGRRRLIKVDSLRRLVDAEKAAA